MWGHFNDDAVLLQLLQQSSARLGIRSDLLCQLRVKAYANMEIDVRAFRIAFAIEGAIAAFCSGYLRIIEKPNDLERFAFAQLGEIIFKFFVITAGEVGRRVLVEVFEIFHPGKNLLRLAGW